MDDVALTAADLAHVLGVDEPTVSEWRNLGLISASRDDTFDARNLERARFVQFAVQSGFDAEEVARISREQQDLVGRFADFAPIHGVGRPLEEMAKRVGLDIGVARQLWQAGGLADQEGVFDEDVPLLRTAAAALETGLPEEALVQLIRVYADSLERVAGAESRLFHLHVHEQLRQRGLAGAELTEATRALSDPLVGLIEPTLVYFHRKAWVRAIRDDLLLHLREDAMPAGDVGEVAVAVFVDLASFTPFTESSGDVAAADLLARFSQLVRDRARAHRGNVVKQIGDEFMVAFHSATDAVRCGVEINAGADADQDVLGVRAGAHAGTALYREADYFGATVNLAARVTAEATRAQFLVTDAAAAAAADIDGIDVTPVGRRTLKGLAAPVELFEVRAQTQPSGRRSLTPRAPAPGSSPGVSASPDDVSSRPQAAQRQR